MNIRRIAMVSGTAFGLLVAGMSLYLPWHQSRISPQQYLGWASIEENPAAAFEAPPMTAGEHVEILLPTLISADPAVRRTGLEALSLAFARAEEDEIPEELREETAESLIAFHEGTDPGTPEGPEFQSAAIKLMITKVKGRVTRDFTLAMLSSENEVSKLTVLKALLVPGALRDREVNAAAFKAAQEDFVPGSLKPALFRRTLGRKAEPALMKLLAESGEPATVAHCAVEVQNLHKPELLGPVIARLESVGLLSDPKLMPWFSGKLLSEHIKTAEGAELIRALRVVWLRPSLTRSTMKSVQTRLAHADPAIRRIVARIIPDAIKYRGIEAAAGEELLSATLKVETDPAVVGEIEGSLSSVRSARRADPPAESSPAAVE